MITNPTRIARPTLMWVRGDTETASGAGLGLWLRACRGTLDEQWQWRFFFLNEYSTADRGQDADFDRWDCTL
jgi:hypothetical protein